ncbi:MAG: DUF6504 family protein [Candidatus Nanopelagicales bacterium]|nr:DUF6504 family protein [Candidatus Nanopelagicales bacterium]
MSRRYADAITVRSASERGPPTEFFWSRRRYRIQLVLARWVERDSWWLSLAPAQQSAELPGERTVWRVEAASGPWVGVYDLCQISGEWFLARSFD